MRGSPEAQAPVTTCAGQDHGGRLAEPPGLVQDEPRILVGLLSRGAVALRARPARGSAVQGGETA
jgi:hypothetical protein